MFCPRCGQGQTSNDSRFCPACGFPLAAVGELLAGGGQRHPAGGGQPHWRPPAAPPQPTAPAELSPRQKGVRQGAMLMLSTLLVVPLLAIFGVAMLGFPGEFVALGAVFCPMGGLLRILYALMLESNVKPSAAPPRAAYVPPPTIPDYLGGAALPPSQGAPIPAQARAARRYNTGELIEPPRASVTDHTTRLLEKQPDEPRQQ